MRPSFHSRLVNGPFDDPGLFISMAHAKRGLLFDLGDVSALSPADILKTSHIFITHTHMDHFIGFDHVLRVLLGRAKRLCLFGPKHFIANVAAKLGAYTWNLVHNYAEGLVIEAVEVHPDKRIHAKFTCQSGFSSTVTTITGEADDPIVNEPALQVHTALLDHQIPSMAYAVKERFHINILKPALEQLEIETGPWLRQFKRLLFAQADPATPIAVPKKRQHHTTQYTLGDLAQKIVRITPGQKIAYIADAVYSQANVERMVSLAQGANHLYIEAAFSHDERDTAKAKYHLTAHQAGTIARLAKVADLTLFHHSPRYRGKEIALEQEAARAFKGK